MHCCSTGSPGWGLCCNGSCARLHPYRQRGPNMSDAVPPKTCPQKLPRAPHAPPHLRRPLSLVMVMVFFLPVVRSSADTFRMPARTGGRWASRRHTVRRCREAELST